MEVQCLLGLDSKFFDVPDYLKDYPLVLYFPTHLLYYV